MRFLVSIQWQCPVRWVGIKVGKNSSYHSKSPRISVLIFVGKKTVENRQNIVISSSQDHKELIKQNRANQKCAVDVKLFNKMRPIFKENNKFIIKSNKNLENFLYQKWECVAHRPLHYLPTEIALPLHPLLLSSQRQNISCPSALSLSFT